MKAIFSSSVTEKTSTIASGAGAILAINGDYYGSQQKGYVIRNGVLYRSTAVSGKQDLVIYEDGSFGIITEGEISAQELLEDMDVFGEYAVYVFWGAGNIVFVVYNISVTYVKKCYTKVLKPRLMAKIK